MRIVKLAADESLTMTVSAIDEVEGQYGPQYDVQGESDDGEEVRIYLSIASAERQLERIEHTLDSVIGEGIKISKVKKGSKQFVNIDRAQIGARTTRAAAPAARKATPPREEEEVPPPESDEEYADRTRGVNPRSQQAALEPAPAKIDPDRAWTETLTQVAKQYDSAVSMAHRILTRHELAPEPAVVQAMGFSIFREAVERCRRGGR